ncbi:hypothetical protein SOVF_157590 [Spinacia oleracea]|nr:hypothetical protein SOVF_157590 [Spinacia oleracea]
MSQVDNRNPSNAKRARTDGGRREDDWTCPVCSNVNFSFRTTCNMRNCTQPRPADHNAKPALRPMQPPQPYSSNPPYGGSGPPPASMYMGMPHYGSSVFNGSSIPPYEVPYSGGSAYHYNYGNRISGGSPYRPMPLSGPPPYSGGSMMGNEKNPKQKMPDGSWKCEKCGNINYPFRTKCNRQNCGADKPAEENKSPSPVADGNEQ